jgi:hypothetical protein
LQTFSAAFGLSAPDLTIIYPDGRPTLNTSHKLGWAVETSLDLQWAHAIAPDAKLGWPCTSGYDLTTGLGSPKAYSFVYDLATMFP